MAWCDGFGKQGYFRPHICSSIEGRVNLPYPHPQDRVNDTVTGKVNNSNDNKNNNYNNNNNNNSKINETLENIKTQRNRSAYPRRDDINMHHKEVIRAEWHIYITNRYLNIDTHHKEVIRAEWHIYITNRFLNIMWLVHSNRLSRYPFGGGLSLLRQS